MAEEVRSAPPTRVMPDGPLLDVSDLKVSFATEDGMVHAVDGVSFTVSSGEVVAVVGESGSGKSVTAMTLMGLTRGPNARFEGRATFDGRDLVTLPDRELRKVRGAGIAMVFQDPMSSLDPVYKVGDQIVEQIRVHERDVSKAQAMDRAVELMERVGVPRARERLQSFPHEFSGGMRQRVMIAMALSCSPRLLIADEPTTALDVTIQAQILDELRQLRSETGAGIILVTHDLGVVADIADRIVVMYAGRVIEQGTLDEIFYDPQHPYTWGLLGSIARLDRDRSQRLPAIPGMPPSLVAPPEGCHFRPRCPHAFDRCTEIPALSPRLPDAPEHLDRCWLEVESKRTLRQVGDQIGLRSEETVIS
jgi:peptide/nickel transport system ATP-binding protein